MFRTVPLSIIRRFSTVHTAMVYVRPCIVINSYNETNQMHQFLKFIFRIKLYMFRTVPVSIIKCFSLYTLQWYMSHRFLTASVQIRTEFRPDLLAANMYDIYHCCLYSEKHLMMDTGTVRNM